ncbi:unnamed protein product (macronuclear) [Paramecium tetraurelia]|uniref:LisH domain-containing protein n=1 Tax=Paramecium tetraurelia TaxID=5888 RepID=A0BH08_PARTE|nr:uncharacterized protein GSPATT00028860001 [Paramecium tetraurelia]CAK57825.1 unnamed protein product [Paramecium tetraurelia]|eukprot:XP_001425223.1 hypothetical protein (macronuclear) [Paramecium tetraurelia strain d4-2]
MFYDKLQIQQQEYNLLYNEYHKHNPNWKVLAQKLEMGANGLKLKIECAEILFKIGNLSKLCQNFYNQNTGTKKSDIRLKIKINTPTQSQTIEEEIKSIEVKAKLQEIISVRNASENTIIQLEQIQSDSALILFENNLLLNFNLKSQCIRQEIQCKKFDYFDKKVVIQNNNLLQFYLFEPTKKMLVEVRDLQVLDAIWFKLRQFDLIYQSSNLHFYKKSLQINEEVQILQWNSNIKTINFIFQNKLALFYQKSFNVYSLNNLTQIEWHLNINENIQEIKQNSNDYLVLIGMTQLYMVSIEKKSIVKKFTFEQPNCLIIPSPAIPYLFLIANSGSVYQSKIYFHNTKQILSNIVSQHPTAIFMDDQTILIGDDLGFLQRFKYSLGE